MLGPHGNLINLTFDNYLLNFLLQCLHKLIDLINKEIIYHTNCYTQTMQVLLYRYCWKPDALVYFISLCKCSCFYACIAENQRLFSILFLCEENFCIQQMQLFSIRFCWKPEVLVYFISLRKKLLYPTNASVFIQV